MKNNKVLLIAPYSFPSACGIWARVYSDAKVLRDAGFDITVYSSNRIKGTSLKSGKRDTYEGINLRRFRVLLSLGENALFWPQMFFSILRLRPSIIHVHGYRHPHTLFGGIAGKLIGSKVILTTHAPFDKDPRAPFYLKAFDKLYDLLIGWWQLRWFNKVIRITDWEVPFLKKLGYKNAVKIPNSINPIFLQDSTSNKKPATKKLLYMGRIDPVKRLEWMLYAAEKLPNYKFKIRGPVQGYNKFESKSENLVVENEKYKPEEFINELKESNVFILPSIRESFGIVALEAMAMGNILIASDAKGPMEYIVDGVNGFIIKDKESLVEKIEYIYNNWNSMSDLINKGKLTASEYSEDKIGKLLLELYITLVS
ncbi:MAG: glycosyltransferase family 4 protein [Candidatus Dojkabacteria bacterium]